MINRVVMVGRMTRDPELRRTQNGSAVTSFTLAMNRPKRNDEEQHSDFISCVVWNKVAEFVEKDCSNWSLVGFLGRLRWWSYDIAQGQRVYVTEVVCDSVQFLETKPRDKYEEQQYHSQSTYNPNQYQQPTQNQQQDSFMNENPPFNIMEDDIQF